MFECKYIKNIVRKQKIERNVNTCAKVTNKKDRLNQKGQSPQTYQNTIKKKT